MPKRTDIETIFIFRSGPIVISQACEFDYSGTQACKTLLAEGYRVVLANSTPATIMTDPEFATRTYIEPLRADELGSFPLIIRPSFTLGGTGGGIAEDGAAFAERTHRRLPADPSKGSLLRQGLCLQGRRFGLDPLQRLGQFRR